VLKVPLKNSRPEGYRVRVAVPLVKPGTDAAKVAVIAEVPL
jgi:hypothetical protein